jgi:hypothetical protein
MRESLVADQMLSSAALQAKSWEIRLNRRARRHVSRFDS